jgi:demethylspheroidene O-methyltransferase
MADKLPGAGAPRGRLQPSDWWASWRNRLIRSQGFQRWAASFPLTRGIARKRAGELFDLVAGFVYSQVLAATVRLDILEMVAQRPLPLDVIAGRTGLPAEAARRLCVAAAALRLLDDRGQGRFGLGDLGAALLGNPGISAMVRHHALLYGDLRDPVALLRGEASKTDLSAFWAYASTAQPGALGADEVAEYSRLMAVSQEFIAGEILDAYDVSRHRCLLDVGGGEGAFVRAAAARAARTRFMLFDLPAVAERATAAFAAAGLSARAEAHGGDLFSDALPHGADAASLVRVLYDHPTPRALAILKAVRAALPQDGTLLVAEPMAGTGGAERMGAVYFSFYLLAMRGGDSRSAGELTDLLTQAGFSRVETVRTRRPLFTGLLVARP